MPTEREKMLAGEPYVANDPELSAARVHARRLWLRYNALDPEATAERRAILEQLVGRAGANVDIQAPFYCDYGTNIEIGADVFMNFDCTLLDCALITIGAQTQIGPAVQLYTATHPLDAAERVSGVESAKPITIGRRVWLGGGTIVLPGVSIGDDTVVGAGSVVTRDLPAGVIAAGNPCRVLRPIPEASPDI
jgi:maltose O-acetyltransferase